MLSEHRTLKQLCILLVSATVEGLMTLRIFILSLLSIFHVREIGQRLSMELQYHWGMSPSRPVQVWVVICAIVFVVKK